MPIIVVLLLIIIVILAPGLLVIPLAAIGGAVYFVSETWQWLVGGFVALSIVMAIVQGIRENRKPGYHDAKRKRIEERRERKGSGDRDD